MAAISPSPDTAPSEIPPASFASTPQPPPPPPSSQTAPIEPPPNAIPQSPSTSVAQSPSSNSSDPIPASPPPVPVGSSPPPTPIAPPPSLPASPPIPIVSLPPASNAPPPSIPEVPPPPPPPIDPPPISPPPLPPPTPPLESPPPPPLSTPPTSSPPPPPPPPSSSPPPLSAPTPPSSTPPTNPPPPSPSSSPPLSSPPPPSSQLPEIPPPPPSSQLPEIPPPPPSSIPPENSPPPPSSRPPANSPPPPSSNPPTSTSPPAPQAPQSSPRPHQRSPPSPPSTGPSPSDHQSTPPPSVTSVTPTHIHVSPSPPSPSSQTTVPSPPTLPTNNSPIDASQTSHGAGNSGGIGPGGTAAIGVIAGVLVLGLIGLVAFWMFKRKKKSFGADGGHVIPASGGSSPRSDAKLFVKTEHPSSHFGGSSSDTATEHGGFGHSRALFAYQELFEATSGFSDQNLLGEGGFGRVYKGIFTDGRVVAVKQLKVGASQGELQFKAEVETISRIHHRHLVSLVGYCVSESRRLLVYEYVPNNTLHFHLHGEGRPVLDWATRFRIAEGAARGIAYLHEDCHPRIIHRDIKSSNILLDNNCEARVSDFGLAKLAMDADTHISTRVMGTFGYLAPEYATSGKLTEKSDVYSFGVVLLELITGRRPVDVSQPLGDESLVEWARPLLNHALDGGELEGLIDPQLENNYVENEIFRMIEAAAACVRHSAAKRPRMGQIVRAFDGVSDSGDLSNGLRVGESQLYDSAEQSAEIRWYRRMAFGRQDISTDFFSQPAQNVSFSAQRGHNASFSGYHGRGGIISRQQSQDAQNPVFSGQSRQSGNLLREQSQGASNPGFSGRSRQSDNFSRQQSQDGLNPAFSGQSRRKDNLSRPQSEGAQNSGFSGQSRHNVYSSAQHDFVEDISR